MSRLAIVAVVASALTPQLASAQAQQPYAGFEIRPIKALSGEQIGDLKSGRGMGLALAAELNGYPGPVHVLELAEALRLSEAQRAKVQTLFDEMKAQTVPLGEKLIALEATLDQLFADKTITEAGLRTAVHAIGATQTELRTAHLKYHLATLAVLTPMQVKHYAELRGYAGGAQAQHQHGGHRH